MAAHTIDLRNVLGSPLVLIGSTYQERLNLILPDSTTQTELPANILRDLNGIRKTIDALIELRGEAVAQGRMAIVRTQLRIDGGFQDLAMTRIPDMVLRVTRDAPEGLVVKSQYRDNEAVRRAIYRVGNSEAARG